MVSQFSFDAFHENLYLFREARFRWIILTNLVGILDLCVYAMLTEWFIFVPTKSNLLTLVCKQMAQIPFCQSDRNNIFGDHEQWLMNRANRDCLSVLQVLNCHGMIGESD